MRDRFVIDTRRGIPTITALGSLALALAATGCSVEHSAGRLERCALGVRAEPFDGEDPTAAVARFETLVDRPVVFERQFYALDDAVPGPLEEAAAASGHIPLISLAPARVEGGALSWAAIADPDDPRAGPILDALAERLVAFDRPIFVIFDDEPTAGATGTPAEYVAAWRRVVEVVRAAGGGRVSWVWSMTSSSFPSVADAWYPGDDHVDWIGVTGFNYYDGTPSSAWRTFAGVFASFYEWARDRGKPLFVTTTACAENPLVSPDAPKSKAVWLRQAVDTLEEWPEIQAMAWFHGNGDPTTTWRADSSPEALAAFRALAAAPHLDVSGALLP